MDAARVKPGEVLGQRFELKDRACSGGMGEVFRARDRASGETVAVKVLLEGPGTAPPWPRPLTRWGSG